MYDVELLKRRLSELTKNEHKHEKIVNIKSADEITLIYRFKDGGFGIPFRMHYIPIAEIIEKLSEYDDEIAKFIESELRAIQSDKLYYVCPSIFAEFCSVCAFNSMTKRLLFHARQYISEQDINAEYFAYEIDKLVNLIELISSSFSTSNKVLAHTDMGLVIMNRREFSKLMNLAKELITSDNSYAHDIIAIDIKNKKLIDSPQSELYTIDYAVGLLDRYKGKSMRRANDSLLFLFTKLPELISDKLNQILDS